MNQSRTDKGRRAKEKLIKEAKGEEKMEQNESKGKKERCREGKKKE